MTLLYKVGLPGHEVLYQSWVVKMKDSGIMGNMVRESMIICQNL